MPMTTDTIANVWWLWFVVVVLGLCVVVLGIMIIRTSWHLDRTNQRIASLLHSLGEEDHAP